MVALAPNAEILGFDGFLAMLELARPIVAGEESVTVDLSAYGFGELVIPLRRFPGVHLFRADIERLPVADGVADLVLSVNTVDRLRHGPERTLTEARRMLRSGGTLVFTDPLNWAEKESGPPIPTPLRFSPSSNAWASKSLPGSTTCSITSSRRPGVGGGFSGAGGGGVTRAGSQTSSRSAVHLESSK